MRLPYLNELKPLRRLLKIFPVKSPALKVKKDELKKELDSVRETLKFIEDEGNSQENKPKIGVDENILLGELLGYLRTNKLMSALMVCRQISQIKIEDSQAIIFGENGEDLTINESIALELKKFFGTKGLGYKIYKETKTRNPIDELNDLLGGKLRIE